MSYSVLACKCCMDQAQEHTLTDEAGRVWRFEVHRYFGPTVLRKDGNPSDRQPREGSPFWPAYDKWRTTAGHGEMATPQTTEDIMPKPEPKIGTMGPKKSGGTGGGLSTESVNAAITAKPAPPKPKTPRNMQMEVRSRADAMEKIGK